MGIALYPDAVGVELIRKFASGLADVAGETAASTPVATCGDWLLHDLVWHLTEVEDFWRFIVDHRPDGPDDYVEPDRPDDEALPGRLRAAADSLAMVLAGGDPEDEAWSWSDDHTLGFTIRRQTHEALIHYVDGVLAAGRPLPTVDPLLAADGVDELVNVMLCGVPAWAEFTRTSGVVQLHATDTDDSWTLAFGRMTGTSTHTGKTYDLDAMDVVAGEHPDVVIDAAALELNLWMWGRRDTSAVNAAGDGDLATKLRGVLKESTG